MSGSHERSKGARFRDARLKTRFGKLLNQLAEKIGAAIPDGLPGLGSDEGRVSVLR